MRSDVIIMCAQDPATMRLPKDNDMIQALAAGCA